MLAPRTAPKNLSKTPGIYLYDWTTIPGHVGKPWQARVLDERKRRAHGGTPMKSKRFDTQKQAETWAKDEQAKMRTGVSTSGRVNAQALLDEYLAGINASKSTQRHKNMTAYVLKSFLADSGVTDLADPRTLTRAQTWIDALVDGRRRLDSTTAAPISVATKIAHGGRVQSFGVWAEEMEYVQKNPFRKLRLPRAKDAHRREVFTVRECRALVRKDVRESSAFGLYFATLLYGGFRRLEAAWLRREHVVLDKEVILVERPDSVDAEEAALINHQHRKVMGKDLRKPIVKELKNNKPRFARLEPELAYLLRPLLAGDPKGYVFPRSLRTTTDDYWTEHLDALCRAAAVERKGRVPHCLRHTNACLLDAIGIGAATLRDHLGHASSSMTDNYTHDIRVMRMHVAGWNGHIRLLTDEPGSPHCTPLHPGPVSTGRATEGGEQGSKGAGGEGGAASELVVITDEPDQHKDNVAVLASPAPGRVRDPADSLRDPAFSYEYTRKNHTECLVVGDVMTFRWASLPLVPEQR